MRYFVRNREGEELVVPTLADLHVLYAQGFLGDEDLVRSERSDRWVRAGSMPALHGVRLRRSDPRKFWMLVLAAVAFAAGVAILVAR
jgi:hypothetical protein